MLTFGFFLLCDARAGNIIAFNDVYFLLLADG